MVTCWLFIFIFFKKHKTTRARQRSRTLHSSETQRDFLNLRVNSDLSRRSQIKTFQQIHPPHNITELILHSHHTGWENAHQRSHNNNSSSSGWTYDDRGGLLALLHVDDITLYLIYEFNLHTECGTVADVRLRVELPPVVIISIIRTRVLMWTLLTSQKRRISFTPLWCECSFKVVTSSSSHKHGVVCNTADTDLLVSLCRCYTLRNSTKVIIVSVSQWIEWKLT